MNAFESSQQKMIPAVLLYAFAGDQVLMLHRNVKVNDFHQGKWNGLGGKVELGESFLEAAVREFHEEASLKTEAKNWKWLGQLHFPNFKPQKKEDWMVNVFVIELTPVQAESIPTVAKPSLDSEGTLHWIEKNKVIDLNLWDGDRHFIPQVLKRAPFQGTFYYVDGSCSRFELNPIQ